MNTHDWLLTHIARERILDAHASADARRVRTAIGTDVATRLVGAVSGVADRLRAADTTRRQRASAAPVCV